MTLDDELSRLAHLSFIEFCREGSRWGRGGALEERDGVLLFATGTWVPVLANGAVRFDDRVDAKMVVDLAREWFVPRRRGYTIVVRDLPVDDDLRVACQDAGLNTFGEPSPEMVCRRRLEDRAPPQGVELRWVSTEDDVADFAAVNAAAYATYGMPEGALPATFSLPQRLLDSRHVRSVIAYNGATPLAAAQTFASHGIACVTWVGTVPEGRGRGLGEAVTRAVTNAGFDMGARVNTLQASVMGAPIYRRMGYETIYHYDNYVALTPPR